MYDLENVITAIESVLFIPDENTTIYFLDYDMWNSTYCMFIRSLRVEKNSI